MSSSIVESPLGQIFIEESDNQIIEIRFLDEGEIADLNDEEHPIQLEAKQQFKAYFNSGLHEFDLPLNPHGTEFQKMVWQKLTEIPFGKTTSYGELSKNLGDPNYVRAVGNANGKNPIAIVIPCHRVIGSTGNLVGYASGLWRKKYLLDFEGNQISGQGQLF